MPNVEQRLEKLEVEVEQLKRQSAAKSNADWFSVVAGSFKDDPDFAEIVRLGRDLRRADRPSDVE